MYNHIVNNWQREKIISVNPFIPEVYEHLLKYFQQWLTGHPRTKVVRFTTFAFMFMLLNDAENKQKLVDWTGYCEAVSSRALLEFEKVKGYRLTSEDFVDMGRFNPTFQVPSRRYLDWIDFIHDFVVRFAGDLVSLCHEAGKKAAMFWGDHWIGVEPYSPDFQKIGIDIHVGACEHGTDLRRVADAPGKQIKEIRLYPYFFPDIFRDGGEPMAESMHNWVKIRRALMRAPVDRIGWGGYLSLAYSFPGFADHMEDLSCQFRTFLELTEKESSYKALIRVAVLNAWGAKRSWISHAGVENKFKYSRNDSMVCLGTDMLECLSGLPLEVKFISFQDIIDKPSCLEDIDVIINDGELNSAWSGGKYWADPKVIVPIRRFVYDGGGFIGIGSPSACDVQGRLFQLSDILGVQKEIGHSINASVYKAGNVDNHFVTRDMHEAIIGKSFVYPCNENVDICMADGPHVHIAANKTEKGRSVFISELPFSFENCRLLQRSIFWAASQEQFLHCCFSSNPDTDTAFYMDSGVYWLVNNSSVLQKTTVYDAKGYGKEVTLEAFESRWENILKG